MARKNSVIAIISQYKVQQIQLYIKVIFTMRFKQNVHNNRVSPYKYDIFVVTEKDV